jgi:GTP-binding protein
MMDKVEIRVLSGSGGAGAVSFRHEKFVPFGGPDGGDGGKGGDVIIKADASLSHLSHFKHKRFYQAEDGGSGRGQKKHGKNGVNLVLTVPAGTVITDGNPSFDSFSITDLAESGQEVIVVKGGRGGLGNSHFATSTNQTPRLAQKGESGKEKELILELKLIAQVGIIGYPNVGKSSLLAAASAARPKIADYAFTTLEPVLGMVDAGTRSFVMAEIPGLISGAHLGRGLGHEFLRHVVRTRLLIHLVDGTSASPVDDMIAVNNELSLFDASLSRKPQVVVVNKIDCPEVRERMPQLKKIFKEAGHTIHFVSAGTGEGVAELMSIIADKLEKILPTETIIEAPIPVLHPLPKETEVIVQKVGQAFILSAPALERLVAGSDTSNPEVRRQIGAILNRPRVRRVLDKAGIKAGDRLRIGDFEWLW